MCSDSQSWQAYTYGWSTRKTLEAFTQQFLDGWSKLHSAVQAPAMPRSVVHAYAFSLLALNEPFVAMLLMTCSYGVLRISEALGLRRANVFYSKSAVTFYLGSTKRGVEEVVVVENRTYLKWFRAFRKYVPSSSCSSVCVASLLVRASLPLAGAVGGVLLFGFARFHFA